MTIEKITQILKDPLIKGVAKSLSIVVGTGLFFQITSEPSCYSPKKKVSLSEKNSVQRYPRTPEEEGSVIYVGSRNVLVTALFQEQLSPRGGVAFSVCTKYLPECGCEFLDPSNISIEKVDSLYDFYGYPIKGSAETKFYSFGNGKGKFNRTKILHTEALPIFKGRCNNYQRNGRR